MLKIKSLISISLLILSIAFASSAQAQNQVKIDVNSFEKIRKNEAALQYFFLECPKEVICTITLPVLYTPKLTLILL